MNQLSYAMNTTLRAIKSLSIAVRSKLLSPIHELAMEYDSEDHANNDIADPNTDTTPKILDEMLMSSPLNYSRVRLHLKKDNEKCNKRSTLKFMNLD
jgi:hypothetical protein